MNTSNMIPVSFLKYIKFPVRAGDGYMHDGTYSILNEDGALAINESSVYDNEKCFMVAFTNRGVFDSMLSDYKKTQEPKEQRCGKEHPTKPVHDPDSYLAKECLDESPSAVVDDKPVFEIEMLIGGGKNVDEIYKPGKFIYRGFKYSIFITGEGREYSRRNSKIKTRSINTRSDEEKAIDDILGKTYLSNDRYADSILEAIKAGKIHGVKWVGEQ